MHHQPGCTRYYYVSYLVYLWQEGQQNIQAPEFLETYRFDWITSLSISYFWNDWSANVYGKSTSRSLSMNSSYVWTPASYGGVISWHHNNWSVEAGTDNPFSSRLRKVEFIDADVYRYHTNKYSPTFQQTGYLKVAYTFDFGKKTSRDSKNLNTTINSAILKSE